MEATSPWAKVVSPTADISFEEIMSEELARDLHQKELLKNQPKAPDNDLDIPQHMLDCLKESTSDADPDELLAQMLQAQFNDEYNAQLRHEENRLNGQSKVTISLTNYRIRGEKQQDFDDYEEPIAMEERKDWDRFETVEKQFNAIPKCGYIKSSEDGKYTTKHDINIAGRRNAGKVMSFPPEFHTGDGAGFDMRLSNAVFNSLKAHSVKEQSRRNKLKDKKEDRSTADKGMDEYSCLLMYKLINRQLLRQVNGIVSTGKEAIILHADSDPAWSESQIPDECAIKVFKTTLNEFKQRDRYIKDDYRFKDRFSKQNPRKIIHLWAEKEMHNLMRIARAGIPCPQVVMLKEHILVMSFIGENEHAASKLKDAILDSAELCLAYEQVSDAMIKMYKQCRLVHADMSEYNILWHLNQCWFIDVSQAVENTHPLAYEFLLRDCANISNFFTKKGVDGVMSSEQMFTHIVGMSSAMAFDSLKPINKRKVAVVNHEYFNDVFPDIDDFELAWQQSQLTNRIESCDVVDSQKS